jgi:hypothetical protein
MTLKQIEVKQRKISKALKTSVHPNNSLAFEMNKLYRELEQTKLSLRGIKSLSAYR